MAHGLRGPENVEPGENSAITTRSTLFAPLQIGPLSLAGRLFKTATAETRASVDGLVTDSLIDYYRPIASAGTPLIITGNIYTSRAGQSTPLQMGADDDNKIAGLRRLVRTVHEHGGKIIAQLNHCGRQVLPGFGGVADVVSASRVRDLVTGTKPRPLEPDEIAGVVKDFADAAWRCREAGFDGIQIHAAHGYLISQFLTPHTNRRTDAFGGSFANRIRLLRMIHTAIRERVDAGCAVIVKLNGADYLPLRNGLGTAELVRVAHTMERDGIHAVEVSVGHYESGYPMVRGTFHRAFRAMLKGSVPHLPPARRLFLRYAWPLAALASNLIWHSAPGFNRRYARQFVAELSIPVICVGGFVTRESMQAALAAGDCDAVSAARAFVADPFLYRHLREGVAGPRCVDCNACVGRIGTNPLDCYHPRVRARKDAILKARDNAHDLQPDAD